MAAKCPVCEGCMKVKGSYFKPMGNGITNALIRWFCKFCGRYFVREGIGLPLEEVQGVYAGDGADDIRNGVATV